MRVTFSVFMLAALLFGDLEAGEDSSNSRGKALLKLEVAGIASTEGKIMIALWDSYDNFHGKGEPLRKKALEIKYSSVFWDIDDLPTGDYMISIYHDRNGNGKLDFNLLHIPKEPYGFSNDARGQMGPPSWEDSKFSLSPGEQRMKITLSN